ncbi:hypothetical protein ACLOJK_033156 [Asimina triloba]
MNDYGDENRHCYVHPKEAIVGICAHCLKERLLILAAKQAKPPLPKDNHRPQKVPQMRKPNVVNLPKVFALSSLLQRQESRRRKSDACSDQYDTFTTREDSFISIKFEDNGNALWDTVTSCRTSTESFELACNSKENKDGKEAKSVVEHVKPRTTSLRWRKRMGHLVQLMRWKSSNKAGVSHVGRIVEGVKGRKGWMRALTKRRAVE